jgi:hypothetical protein
MLRGRALGFARRLGIGVVALLLLFGLLHVVIRYGLVFRQPGVRVAVGPVVSPRPGLSRFEKSYRTERGKVIVFGLQGSPEQIGYTHAQLAYRDMVANEGRLLASFADFVPSAVVRTLLQDVAQVRYRELDQALAPARRAELSASAAVFTPDPYEHVFPTYQRFIYLTALYDIALSFEHSPLVGCTTFTLRPDSNPASGVLLARAFDFEVDPIFDQRKAVFLVQEDGALPYASVAWPGLVGVVSGMNREGLALVVHGGRAGPVRTRGEPVVHALRRVLGQCRTVEDAARAFAEQEPLVSHIVIAADARGHAARIERVPGAAPFVAPLPARSAVTNHFEGPSASDPKNERVRASTSTLARRERADELVRGLPAHVGAADAIALLRDRRAAGGAPLPLGDRRAIDALIATHGVVMDTASRTLWVSESPHLLGRFVAFDLARLFNHPSDDELTAEAVTLPADPLLGSAAYAEYCEAQRSCSAE